MFFKFGVYQYSYPLFVIFVHIICTFLHISCTTHTSTYIVLDGDGDVGKLYKVDVIVWIVFVAIVVVIISTFILL